ncbi:protein rep, partial [Mammaliicoccus sciuri]|uniref:protein rep n=1 Tax=Mammaliicoccus sciuri TaxID=1296 RepID=UPI003F578D67
MDKYTEKKRRNQVFQNFIERHVGENQMALVKECNTFLSFVTDKSLEKQKLYKANSCKNRFCPVCAWRKARKDALSLSLMMQHVKQAHEKEFIFLTLTTPNVSKNELENEIKHYNQSFRRLSNRTKFDAYYQSLKGKQVLVYSGLFKEARKLLKNGDLDYLKEIDPTEYIYQIFYIWKQKEYLASELH